MTETSSAVAIETEDGAVAAVRGGKGQFPDGIARYQFERMGYFCTDRDSTPDHLVFNRTCTLKDSWAKIK